MASVFVVEKIKMKKKWIMAIVMCLLLVKTAGAQGPIPEPYYNNACLAPEGDLLALIHWLNYYDFGHYKRHTNDCSNMARDYKVIPLKIDKYTELDDFDEYEAHAHDWPDDLIRAALREIDRRETSECCHHGYPLDDCQECSFLDTFRLR